MSVDMATTDLAMIWLVKELQQSAQQGHILEHSEVFKRYCTLSAEAGTVVQQSLTSHMHFQRGIVTIFLFILSHYYFIVMHDQPNFDRQTLLVLLRY